MPTAPGDLFPIRYGVQGGSTRVDLALDVASDGSFLADVLTDSSLPQTHPLRLGRFAGQLPPEVLASLIEWATGPGGRDEMAAPAAHGTVARLLTVGGRDPVLVDGASLPEGLEESLATAAAAALSDPVAAVEVGADDAGDQLVIRGLGTQALNVLLFDRGIPGYWVRVWRDDPEAPGGRLFLDAAAVEELVEAGKLPEGPVVLGPGETLAVPLPPAGAAAAQPGGGFMFWRRGEGAERRLMIGTW